MTTLLAIALAAQLNGATYVCPRPDWCTVYAHEFLAVDIIRNPISGRHVYVTWNPALWEVTE